MTLGKNRKKIDTIHIKEVSFAILICGDFLPSPACPEIQIVSSFYIAAKKYVEIINF